MCAMQPVVLEVSPFARALAQARLFRSRRVVFFCCNYYLMMVYAVSHGGGQKPGASVLATSHFLRLYLDERSLVASRMFSIFDVAKIGALTFLEFSLVWVFYFVNVIVVVCISSFIQDVFLRLVADCRICRRLGC
jgi:hypothetical protein